ncbi:MAG: hypothetical protein ACRDKV_02565 [Solirubrobacterales bacterium]
MSGFKRDWSQLRRSRVFGAIAVVALAAAVVAAPCAWAAGDPVQDGKLTLKLKRGFKKALKRNGVRLRPRRFVIRPGSSAVNPITGVSELSLKGKLRARAHGNRVVARKLTVRLEDEGGYLAGFVTGAIKGRRVGLFRLSPARTGTAVTRIAWGARIDGVSARLTRRFALKLNRTLDLNSLRPRKRVRVGRVSIVEQPRTVQINERGSFMFVDVPVDYLPPSPLAGSGKDPNTIAAKLPAHCVGPIISIQAVPGPDPNNPARLTTAGLVDPVLNFPPPSLAAIFRFPVVGGSVGPDGKAGALDLTGGIRVSTGASGIDAALFTDDYSPGCAKEQVGLDTSNTILENNYFHPGDPNTGPDLTLGKIHGYVTVSGRNPGCTFADGGPPGCGIQGIGGPGFIGNAAGQLMDLSKAKVNADPNAHKVTIENVLIVNNGLAATTFNQIFESGPLFPSGGDPAHDPLDFVYGDKFGIARMILNTR